MPLGLREIRQMSTCDIRFQIFDQKLLVDSVHVEWGHRYVDCHEVIRVNHFCSKSSEPNSTFYVCA